MHCVVVGRYNTVSNKRELYRKTLWLIILASLSSGVVLLKYLL